MEDSVNAELVEGEAPKTVREQSTAMGAALPRSALYLAIAEVFIAAGIKLNNKALMVNLFGLTTANTVMLNFAMGSIYATILTLVATIQWTAIVTCLASLFHLLILIWMQMPNATCQSCAYMAPALSMFTATLEPIRLAFLSDQLASAKPSYIKPYFTFIAGTWFLGISIAQLFTFFLEGDSIATVVSTTIFMIFILYAGLVFLVQVYSKDARAKYCAKVRFAAKEIYWKHEGKKYWEIIHIGITLTGHFAGQLILNMAQKVQIRSIQYNEDVSDIGEGVLVALPPVLAVAVIAIMGFCVTPLLQRRNKKLTDLQYIGLGMVFGCVAMILTMRIQTDVDKELKPPRRQECLLFLFNLLPSNTTFQSKVFGKADNAFIQVGGISLTAFISRNVVGVDEYPIAVINLEEKMYMETHIQLLEGKTVSYFVMRDSFETVSGLVLDPHHFFVSESTIFIGCALNDTCDGKKISFLNEGTTKAVKMPPKDKFVVVSLRDGTYTVNALVDGEEITLNENFTTKTEEIHAGIVYEKEPGVPDITIFSITKPEKIPVVLYIFQQILIAFRDGFFTVGLLRFLYYQTPPNSPARPFVYAAFYFIYEGLPYIVTGGIRTSVFNFLEEFVVQVYLAYYACCTILFINLACKYENMERHGQLEEDEDD